jgi:hypothetical protein
VVGGGLAWLSEERDLPFLIPIIFALVGGIALWLGVDTIRQGQIQLFDRFHSRKEIYAGLSARLLGIIIFLFGAGLTYYAVWEWMQPGEAGNFLVGLAGLSLGWGILLAVFGFFTLLFGLIRLISGSAHPQEQRSALIDFGFRMQGLIGTFVGGLMVAAGLWLMLR